MMVQSGGGRAVAAYLFDAFDVTEMRTQTFITSAVVSNYRLTITANSPSENVTYTWIKTKRL